MRNFFNRRRFLRDHRRSRRPGDNLDHPGRPGQAGCAGGQARPPCGLPGLAALRPARREEPPRRPAQRPLVPRRRRLCESLRGRLRRHDRGQALRGHGQRHQRPLRLAGVDRHRAGRRSDRSSLHLHRHHQYRAPAVRPTRLRRHRSRDVPDRPAEDRGGHHRADRGDHAGASGRQRGRHGRHPRRSPGSTSCRSSRTPARPTWPNGRGRRSARWARPAASASRSPRTSPPAKAGRS